MTNRHTFFVSLFILWVFLSPTFFVNMIAFHSTVPVVASASHAARSVGFGPSNRFVDLSGGLHNVSGLSNSARAVRCTTCIPSFSAQAKLPAGVTMVEYYNWAGYVYCVAGVSDYQCPNSNANSGVTEVIGEWTVPNVASTSSSNEYSSTWIGIGGADPAGDLVQTGTEEDVTPSGARTFLTWWEILPAGETVFTLSGGVSPGDTIYAKVSYGGTNLIGNQIWNFYMEDVTTGASSNLSETCYIYCTWTPSSFSSADFIEEATTVGTISQLPAFTQTNFWNDQIFVGGSTTGVFLSPNLSSNLINAIIDNPNYVNLAVGIASSLGTGEFWANYLVSVGNCLSSQTCYSLSTNSIDYGQTISTTLQLYSVSSFSSSTDSEATNLGFGMSIKSSGGTVYGDSSHDVYGLSISSGTNGYTRQFSIVSGENAGSYGASLAIWYLPSGGSIGGSGSLEIATNGYSSSILTVYNQLSVGSPSISPSTISLSQSTTLTASPSGGSGGYSYSWNGLPPGCQTVNQVSFSCTPTHTGQYSVSVQVTDSNGARTVSGSSTLTVIPSINTDKSAYTQGDTIHYTGSGFTPNGEVYPCLTTNPPSGTCITNEPNADSSGNVAGSFTISLNWPTGSQQFWVYDVSTNTNSVSVPLTINILTITTTQSATITATLTSTIVTSSTSTQRTTTTTTTASTSTSTVGQLCYVTSTSSTTSVIIQAAISTTSTSSTTTTTTSTTSSFQTTTFQTSTSTSTSLTTTVVTVCTQTSTATTTFTATSTFTRPSTTISFLLNPSSISLGSPVTLSGSIVQNPGAVQVTVSFSQDSGSTWTTLMLLMTDSSGSYSTSWVPPYPGSYLLKASWNGSSQLAGSTSSAASLTVAGAVTPSPTLLLAAPSTAFRSQVVSLSIVVFNPSSSGMKASITIEITGPGNYLTFDVIQVNVAASSQSTGYFDWTIPNSSGMYTVTVGLLPPKPAAFDAATIQVT